MVDYFTSKGGELKMNARIKQIVLNVGVRVFVCVCVCVCVGGWVGGCVYVCGVCVWGGACGCVYGWVGVHVMLQPMSVCVCVC